MLAADARLRRRRGAAPGAVTRQMMLAVSSLTSSAPVLSHATQVGRPWVWPSPARKLSSTWTGLPSGLPRSSKRTNTTS
jgi:hypothetical protein